MSLSGALNGPKIALNGKPVLTLSFISCVKLSSVSRIVSPCSTVTLDIPSIVRAAKTLLMLIGSLVCRLRDSLAYYLISFYILTSSFLVAQATKH